MSRSKNAINVIMKNYCDMCFGAIVFWLVGYGLMFGTNATGWIGADHFAVRHAGADRLLVAVLPDDVRRHGRDHRQRRHRRADALLGLHRRVVRRSPAFVYPLFGSWAWGSLYSGEGWLRKMGFIDFAGSTVVHSVGGWCALAALLVVRPRLGRYGSRRTGARDPGPQPDVGGAGRLHPVARLVRLQRREHGDGHGRHRQDRAEHAPRGRRRRHRRDARDGRATRCRC